MKVTLQVIKIAKQGKEICIEVGNLENNVDMWAVISMMVVWVCYPQSGLKYTFF